MTTEVCPNCQNPVELAASGSASIVCGSCGTEIRLEQERTRTIVNERQRLDRFELLEQVGAGAFGVVWKARDPVLGRLVAVKIPHRGHLVSAKDVERFLREARSTAMLRHPGIVSVHEVGKFEELPYLVSEFVDGVTLADLLTAQQVGCREAAELVGQVADALEYAHSLGVVHRDVKPSNIMLERSGVRVPADGPAPLGKPMLMDFGLALRDEVESTLTQEGQVLGTPAYMSPEQASGQSHGVDRRSDVYSLGVVLYQILTGVLPFKGNTRMILDQVLRAEPPSPRRSNPKVPRDLETITLKCLTKEPGQRYATTGDLAADLRRWLAGEPVRARPVGPIGRLTRWSRRNPLVAGLLAALFLVFATAFAAVTWKWQDAEAAEAKAKQAEASADTARHQAESRADEIRQAMVRLNAANEEIRDGMNRLNAANQMMHSAKGRVQRRQYAQALADLNKAVELRPDNSQVWAERAKFYADLGLWDQAAPDCAREFALLPSDDDPLIWFSHALLQLVTGDKKGYQAVCERMLEHFRETSEFPVAVMLARTWGLGGEHVPEALWAALVKARVVDSAEGWQFYVRGMAYLRAGRHREAIAALDVARQSQRPDDRLSILANFGLALAYRQVGNVELAVANFNMGESMFDQAIDVARGLPRDRWPFWHDFAEAQLLYRQVHAVFTNSRPTDHVKVFMQRGGTYRALGDVDRAAAQFAQAVELQPNDTSLRLARARMFAESNRHDEADAEYAQAVAKAPKNLGLWTERAGYFAKRKLWDKAFGDFDHAIELTKKDGALTPGAAPLLLERGRIYAGKADWDKAADDYANIFKLRALDPPQYFSFLGKAGAELAQWDAAFERAVVLRPEDPRLWIARGRHLARTGQTAKSAAAYAHGVDPEKPDDNAWLECLAAQLLNNDTDAYEKLCRRLVEKHAATTLPQLAHEVVRSCVLAPNRAAAPDRVLALAKQAVEAKDHPPQSYVPSWYWHALGAAHYRAGNFAEAQKLLELSMVRDQSWPGNVMNRVFLAMTCHKLGKADLAQHWLDETEKWLQVAHHQIGQEPYGFPSGIYPADWLITRVLRHEAETMIKLKNGP